MRRIAVRRKSVSAAILLAAFANSAAAPSQRVIESVLPALAYGASCSSTVRVQNLADTSVSIEVEAHRASGALAALTGIATRMIRLDPGQQGEYRLDIDEETTAAWVRLRESVPESRPAPVVALSGATECRAGDQLRVVNREVAFPTRNPWFSGDTAGLRGAQIALVNTSEHAARASACYSAGSLYSVPDAMQPMAELRELCSATLDAQIPPFGTREIPVERNGNSHFSLRTRGDAIVLQMLRGGGDGVRIFSVDSTIQFGEEVTQPKH
jgi:hypothetical protein